MGPSSVARLRKVYRSGTLLPGYWVDSSNRNLHLAIHQPCWIGAHRLVGAGQTGTGLYVEFPAMQRTEDLAVFKTADAERPAARWALVINREELTIQIEQRKLPPLHMHRAAMPGRQAGNVGDGSECAHRLASEASIATMPTANTVAIPAQTTERKRRAIGIETPKPTRSKGPGYSHDPEFSPWISIRYATNHTNIRESTTNTMPTRRAHGRSLGA